MKLRVEKLIYGGWGIGHDSKGRTILVRKTAPLDELEAEIRAKKKNYAEAIIKDITQPGPDRISPPCPHFDWCGGCDYQCLSYENQLKIKEGIFAETLSRQGIGLKPEPIIAASDLELQYRNNNRFFFVKDGNLIRFGRHNFLTQVPTAVGGCLLQSDKLNLVLKTLRDHLNSHSDLDKSEEESSPDPSGRIYNNASLDPHRVTPLVQTSPPPSAGLRMTEKDKNSFWQLKVREGAKTGEILIEIITLNPDLPNQEGIVSMLKRIPGVKSIYHSVAQNKSLLDLRRRLIYGSPIIYDKIGRFTFQISPESFFQVNTLGAETLYDLAKRYADPKPGQNILDLYCGTGTISIYLSTLSKKVIGIESVPEAINDAKANAKINRVQNCEFICADTEKYLASRSTFHAPLSTIIVDPPRAGLSPSIIDSLSHLAPPTSDTKIVYVSCDPSTFARDVVRFREKGIELQKVQPVDMFPQTHHIECVGLLERR